MAFGVREAEFAGTLYPADPRELMLLLERLILDQQRDEGKKLRAQGIFLPHGPYLYAAECAAATLAQVEIPDLVVVLHPRTVTAKHGLSEHAPPLVAAPFGHWQTPLGNLPTDLTIARALGADLTADWEEGEHAAEVLLPYLQMLNQDLRACIISVGDLSQEETKELVNKLVEMIYEIGDDRVLLASATDFHFGEERSVTLKRTDDLLDPMERLDHQGLRNAVRDGALMSGWQCVSMMMEVCKGLGCSELAVAAQADSSEASGDFDDVAAYASGWLA